jgi:pimeloyl-ACP methyl ester carboxylesterase
MNGSRLRSLLGGLLVLGMLSACSLVPAPQVTSSPVTAGVPRALKAFYGQRLVWQACSNGMQCATATAPLDWAKPAASARVHLALTKRPASGHRIGTLFMNPGGPGVSAVAFLKENGNGFFDKSLTDTYDIVAWDPRGVGESSAVDCYGTAQLDEFLFGDPDLPQGSAALKKDVVSSSKAFGRACERKSGALLAHVDTISTVDDLDMLRAAVGERKLDYFGFSYGTYVGAEYADRFPKNVGRMALDGAVDPSISSFEENLANTKAFGAALKAYLADCIPSSGCPFAGLTVDQAVDRIGRLLVRLRESPIRASDGRSVNSAYLRTAIDAALYDKGAWKYLTQAFQQILQGETQLTLALADSYVDRGKQGYTDNLFEAIFAVNCLDKPVETDPAVLKRQGAELEAADPLRAADNTEDLGDPVCGNWPVPPVQQPHAVKATGSPAILVLGTTGDPATPLQWAQSLAKQLPRGVLLTFRGEGHTAYRNGSACINDPVDGYLVRGTVPAHDITCG